MDISKLLLQMNNIDNLADINSFGDLDCTTYVKYFNGKYISCNDYQAKMVGMESGTELIGLDDFQLFPDNSAAFFKENDNQVKHCGQTIIFTESFTTKSGVSFIGTSIKSPLRLKNKKIIGIAGVSIIKLQEPPINNSFGLSERQIDCLYYLVRGKSIKEIGKILGLSPRTVEHYLEAVKFKLKCETKSNLIEKALSIGHIRNQLIGDTAS